MTEPKQPNPLKAISDRLDAVLRVRRVPLPPFIPRTSAGGVPTEPENLVPVYWDAAVDLLSRDGGHRELAYLKERLRDRERALNEESEPWEIAAGALGAVQGALTDLVAGADVPTADKETVGQALASLSVDAPEWTWAVTIMDHRVTSYRLLPPGDHAEWWLERWGRVPTFLKVRPDQTWEEVRGATAHALNQAEREEEALWARLVLVRFRLKVVEQVLHELEVLGYVGQYDEREDPGTLDLTDEQRTFVSFALEALDKAESSAIPRTFTSARNEIRDTIGQKPNGRPYGETRLETIATELGAFKKREGEIGSPGPAQTAATYEAFRDRIYEIAERAGVPIPFSEGAAKDATDVQLAQR